VPKPDSDPEVNHEKLAFQVGSKETVAALKDWKKDRFKILLPWTVSSLCIALLMFSGAWAVATFSHQEAVDFTPIFSRPDGSFHDMIWILIRNLMVLLMHLLVCIAAYLARRTVPMQAKYTKGVNRWAHEHAGSFAMPLVAGLTVYSLCWQTWQLGLDLNSSSETLEMSPLALLARAALHGIPELTAIFLPLAACLILGHQKKWNQLAAAAIITAVVAVPVIVIAAAIETWVTHGLF